MPPFSVSLAATHELLPALRLLFARGRDGGDNAAESLRDELLARERDSFAVFAARDDAGRVRGAVLAQALPGALGVAWPPRAERSDAEDSLVAAACNWLRGRGVKVCQAFPTADELPDAAALERNGFRRVTQLVSMRREVDADQDRTAWHAETPVMFAPYRRREVAPFGTVLLATYEGSLDCPELTGTRTTDDILAGYLRDDVLPPTADWYLAWRKTEAPKPEDVLGVVILDAGPVPGTTEIAYLGLVPAARGKGYGDELVRFAIHSAAADKALAMTVSVDSRNEPALRLYRRHGFAEVERREVFLLQLPISECV
jgi:ribosomal protein S18 acetylase RimI-like enzyme